MECMTKHSLFSFKVYPGPKTFIQSLIQTVVAFYKPGLTLNRKKRSRIRETKHLSTDADSSTDTTVDRTKNTQKPDFV